MKRYAKYLILAGVAAVVVASDQLTKIWAERRLASPAHPLVAQVTEKEAGRPLSTLVVERWGLPADEAPAEFIRNNVMQIRAKPGLDAAQHIFANPWGEQTPVGYFVFHRQDLTLSPRVLHQDAPFELEKWLSYLTPTMDTDARRALVVKHFGNLTLAQFVAEAIPSLDEETARTVVSRYTYPIWRGEISVDPEQTVKAGDLYLLQQRRVEVIAKFARLVYAENPGAAWGFLSSASESFRHIFLTLVSLIAGIVILVIFHRLQPGHWSAFICFSAILGGAVGNLIDRLAYHFVIDFIDMHIGESHWPTYNVADIAITLGVAALLAEMLFFKKSPFNAHKRAAAKSAA